ncbi:MAG: BrnA antitoxin family protein [Methylococcaceae bacterium]
MVAEMLRPKRTGRPRSNTPKIFTGIRLDADVLEAFRATGKDWQTRINEALKKWLKDHAA